MPAEPRRLGLHAFTRSTTSALIRLFCLPAVSSGFCRLSLNHTPSSDLHEHDLPGEHQLGHLGSYWLKQCSLKRYVSDTVVTQSSLPLSLQGFGDASAARSLVFTQQFCVEIGTTVMTEANS